MEDFKMGTKDKPAQFDCYANALPDEPMFILLARDPWAPDLVEEWAVKRQRDIVLGVRPLADQAMVDEAQQCAAKMREWRKANDGKWRRAKAG
jgi:hypothetical protein